MRMYFRTFIDYIKPGNDSYYPNGGPSRFTAKEPGVAILHSEVKDYNSRCGCAFEQYHACVLSEEENWRDFMRTAIKFMDGYDEIGCFTFYDECPGVRTPAVSGSIAFLQDYRKSLGEHRNMILVDEARFNAYEGYDCNFYIIFNARPLLGSGTTKNNVAFGRDIYSLKYEKGSIIVWNIDRYKDFEVPGNHTFWGITHDAKKELSATGDTMVGLKNGKIIYAA